MDWNTDALGDQEEWDEEREHYDYEDQDEYDEDDE